MAYKQRGLLRGSSIPVTAFGLAIVSTHGSVNSWRL